MSDNLALRGAFKQATSLKKLPFRRIRNSSKIGEDVGRCFDFSREAGLNAFPILKYCNIVYLDFRGEVTMRSAKIRGIFSFNKKLYVEVFCNLRNENRTFMYDRIKSVECGGEIYHDVSRNIFRLAEFLKTSFDKETIANTDFFVHPNTWSDYRRPVAILIGLSRKKGYEEFNTLKKVSQFCVESFKGSKWEDWRSEQQALALALLGLTIDTTVLNPEVERSEVRGGRFKKAAFDRACSSMIITPGYTGRLKSMFYNSS